MARRIIVATTASGRGVWRKAFAAWQTIPRRVRVVGADLDGPTDVCIVSWGMLVRDRQFGQPAPGSDHPR